MFKFATIALLTISLTNNYLFAQRFTINPEIGLGVQRSTFVSSTIPEPYFSTFHNRGGTIGLSVEYNFRKTDKIYFKLQNFFVSNGVASPTNEKPTVVDAIFRGNSFTSSDQFLLLGFGMKKDIHLNSKSNALYVLGGIDFGFYNNFDTLGGSSGGGYGYTRYLSWKITSAKTFFPLIRLGFSHPILNKKNKEIIQIGLTYHRAFSTIWEHTLLFKYNGPRYGSNDIQTAKFSTQLQTFLITISKEIRIKNKLK